MKVRLFSVLLVAALVLMLPLTASAVDAEKDYRYSVREDGTAVIEHYVGDSTDVVIPEELGGHTVSAIYYGAFSGNPTLRSVTVPRGVEDLNPMAFADCAGLRELSVSAGNTKYHSVGNTIISTATGELVLGCAASEIPYDGSVTSIGGGAFYGCRDLAEVTIPASVTYIGEKAFAYCESLTSISVEKGNPIYCSAGNCIVKNTVGRVVVGCGASEIPQDGSITEIEHYAFYGQTALRSVTIPASITSIGYEVFAGCSGLREIIVAEGNTKYRSVGNCLIDAATATLMQGCASSVIPTDGSVTSIGDSAFSGHSELLSLTVPDGVVSIGHQAFAMCYGLTRITLPESVNYIGISAFFECPRLTLFCERGSYAAKYASENLIPFVGTGEVMFSDVSSSSWYYGAVSFAVNGGLFNGVSDTEFAPDKTMTRAMLVTVLWRLDGKPVPTSDAVFGDVNDGKWYTDAVSWAAACGIVNGISPDRFSPDDPITREQMAAILYRYASYKGEDVSAVGDISAFDDFDRVSGYAAVPMRWANGAGLITGIGTRLEPRDNATRAQVATILQRYCTEA